MNFLFTPEYFERTRQLLVIFNKDGYFEEVSTAWESILGWSTDELKQKTYMELLHPEDLQRSVDAAKKFLEDGQVTSYFENRYRHKNGGYVWFQWDAIYIDSTKMYSIARDITYLKEKESSYQEMQQLAKIGSWKVNLDTKESTASDEIYNIFEVPYGTYIGLKNGTKYFPPGARELLLEKLDNLIRNNEPYAIETPFISAKGNIKYIRSSGRPTNNHGTREIYGLMQDITEGVLKQQELDLQRIKSINAAKMAALGEMAANIAHEINNPLSLVQGRAEQLQNKVRNGTINSNELNQGLEQIQKTSARIAKTIKSLREFSKNDDEAAFIKVPLKTIIDDVMELCSEKLKNDGYNLFMTEIPNIGINCKGSQLSQVFLNLLNNSVEATNRSREKWVHLNFKDLNNKVLIKLIDSGFGIEKSVQSKIMEPFFTTKGNQGTGLGLSIAKNIITEHKGKIYYDNSAERTTFCIELPYN